MAHKSKDEGLLDLLEGSEVMRNYSVLALQIEQFKATLESSTNPDVKKRYQDLLERAEPCFEIERIHGRGSLLNLEHPTIQRFILVHGLVDPAKIEAALRYRSSTQFPFDPGVLSPRPADAEGGWFASMDLAVDAAWAHLSLTKWIA